MDLLAHHRLCARHASEWIPDENDLVCIFVESLVCDGDLVEYVPADQLRGAVSESERLETELARWQDEASDLRRERDELRAVLDARRPGGQ